MRISGCFKEMCIVYLPKLKYNKNERKENMRLAMEQEQKSQEKQTKHTDQLPTTARLMKMLETSPGRFMDSLLSSGNRDMVFHEYLYSLLKKQNLEIPDLIAGSCISKTYAYQFLNGERLPGRNIVLRMAFFLKLKVDETQRLLTLAGKSILYPKLHRDAAILFCLRKKMTLDEANFFLDDLGEETLL